MNYSFRIEYPKTKSGRREWSRQYGLNSIYAGKHWSKRKADAEYWHRITRAAMAREGIGKNPIGKPVTVCFWWNDRLDLDNHSYMGKMIVDGMKGYLIPEDDRRYVAEIIHRWHDEDYILVEVEEIGEPWQKSGTPPLYRTERLSVTEMASRGDDSIRDRDCGESAGVSG